MTDIFMSVLVIGLTLLFLMFFFIAHKQRRITDRYRLKYGFDKEIELKELNNPNNLEDREKAFKERVFKD